MGSVVEEPPVFVPQLPSDSNAPNGESSVAGKVSTTDADRALEAEKPQSRPGPTVNGSPSTLTLYSPTAQLAGSPLLPSLHSVINAAFSLADSSVRALPSMRLRLRAEGQFLQELGSNPLIFTHILHRTDGSDEVVGTASAKLWSPALRVQAGQGGDDGGLEATIRRTFSRQVPADGVEPEVEYWELSMMAVAVDAQRQGVAGLLMGSVEGEVKRKFVQRNGGEDVENGEARKKRLRMILTTIKEVNENFYARKGWSVDSEIRYEPGHLGSEAGFTIIHMSKDVLI